MNDTRHNLPVVQLGRERSEERGERREERGERGERSIALKREERGERREERGRRLKERSSGAEDLLK